MQQQMYERSETRPIEPADAQRRNEQLSSLEAEILDLILKGTGLEAVLECAARGVEQALPGTHASILLYDASSEQLRFGAGPSLPAEYNRAVDGIRLGPSAGSCGTALYHRRRIVVEDIETDPLWEGISDFALGHGLRACWSTPVLDAGGHPLATFAIYYREPRAPRHEELALLDRLTRLIGLSIERTRETQALRESEARYRSMVELVPVAIWKEDWSSVLEMLDELRAGGVTDFRQYFRDHPDAAVQAAQSIAVSDSNAAALRIFEARDEDELVAALAASADYEGGRETFLDQLVAIAERRPHHEAELQLLTATERPVHVLMSRAFPSDSHDASSVLMSLMDVSTRKEAETRLKERIKELNCLYRVLELTTDEALSVDEACAQIAAILPSSLLYPHAAIARVEFDGNVHDSGAGHPTPTAALATPISVEGTVLGRIELAYTEALPDQQAGFGPFLAEERTLIDAIAVRIGRMAAGRRLRERLGQSEKLRATGELTGGVAHDFNNLLTVILGNAAELAEHEQSPEVVELAQMIREAAERGAELTSRLLAFARRQPLDPQPVDVNARLTSMVPLLRRTLGEHIDIDVSCGAELRSALIDAGQLESAVLNLCLNARDAMPDGGRLSIESSNVRLDESDADNLPEVAAGAYVLVSIADTGVGMDAETRGRAFDPFFTTKQSLSGTGLGLSMVYGFAKQSHGHVAIQSEPGLGTVVELYLPVADPAPAAPVPASEARPPARTATEIVLLVEDDDLVREHVAGQLRALGYRVVPAADGAGALKLLRGGVDVDLLFTDLVMPGGIDGRRLAEEALALRPALPVLFTSGYSETAIFRHGRLEAGARLLRKPYGREELAKQLRSLLDGDASERAVNSVTERGGEIR